MVQCKEIEAMQKHAEHTAVRSKHKIQEQRDEITKHKIKIQELEQVRNIVSFSFTIWFLEAKHWCFGGIYIMFNVCFIL